MSARLRELLHALADELADTLEGKGAPTGEAAVPPPVSPPPKSAPRQRRATARLPPMPKSEPSELDMARARRLLQNAGFVETKR